MAKICVEEIEKVLDENVRPELSLHGGNIRIEKIEDFILHVRLTGQCSGCPLAGLTMEKLVDSQLTKSFPGLKKVVLVTGVSDSMIAEAREILKKKHAGNIA